MKKGKYQEGRDQEIVAIQIVIPHNSGGKAVREVTLRRGIGNEGKKDAGGKGESMEEQSKYTFGALS